MKTCAMGAVVGILVLSGVCPLFASAEEDALSALGDVAIHSAYVRRGRQLNDEPVLQPALTVTKGGFSVKALHNLNLTAKDEADDPLASTETDITLSYAVSLEKVAYFARKGTADRNPAEPSANDSAS